MSPLSINNCFDGRPEAISLLANVVATDSYQPKTLAIVYEKAATRFDLGQEDIKECNTF